jgi:outer membrane protein OmpA-like peptidoglycan-associated protein
MSERRTAMDIDIEDKNLLKSRKFAWLAILLGSIGLGTILINAMFSFSVNGAKSAMGVVESSPLARSAESLRKAVSPSQDRNLDNKKDRRDLPLRPESNTPVGVASPSVAPTPELGAIPPSKSVNLRDDPTAASTIPEVPANFEKMVNDLLMAKPPEFRPGTSILSWTGKSNLDQITPLIKAKPEWRFEIGAHTPPSDTPEADRIITERRAEAIAGYLGSEGISNIRMTPRGYGSGKPIADNSTENGRLKNQRVEIRVLSTQ